MSITPPGEVIVDADQGSTEIPMGVLGRPEEVAETVLWMIKTGYVTNKVVGVDGELCFLPRQSFHGLLTI